MFDKYESNFNYKPLTVNEIFLYQNDIFYHYLGVFPNHDVRLLSPFQSDKNPGCRFEYYDSLWWFVDNKTYDGKLYFNCIDFVKAYEGVNFTDAIKIIQTILNLKPNKPNQNSTPKTSVKYKIKIQFTYNEWTESNYFTNKYGIDHNYLNVQPYYNVKDYWCSTKDDLTLVYNRFNLPKNRIAYYFKDTGNTKLYFPDNTINDIKWYTNTVNEVFGYHRMEQYYLSEYKIICICASAKDEMCLNFYTGIPTLALQSETTITLSDEVLNSLRYFNTIYIWLDADIVGYSFTQKLIEILKAQFPSKEIRGIYHSPQLGKDIADITEKNKYELNFFTKKLFG